VTHPSPEELQALVMGMEVADEPALRRHLAACPACSRRLVREARLELDLHALAGSTPRVAGLRGALHGRGLLLAAAACLLLAMVLAWWRASSAPDRRSLARPATIEVAGLSPPCLVDPRALGLGADVLPPTELCRDVQEPSAPLAMPDS
jgi:hypothetical protein